MTNQQGKIRTPTPNSNLQILDQVSDNPKTLTKTSQLQADFNNCFYASHECNYDLHCPVDLPEDDAQNLLKQDREFTNGQNYVSLTDGTVGYTNNFLLSEQALREQMVNAASDSIEFIRHGGSLSKGFTYRGLNYGNDYDSNNDGYDHDSCNLLLGNTPPTYFNQLDLSDSESSSGDSYTMGIGGISFLSDTDYSSDVNLYQGFINDSDDWYDNNLLFKYEHTGLGKEYISGASAYPPRLSTSYTCGAIHPTTLVLTNDFRDEFTGAKITVEDTADRRKGIFNDAQFSDIPSDNSSLEYSFIGNSQKILIDTKGDTPGHVCVVTTKKELTLLDTYDIKHLQDDNGDFIIPHDHEKWFINVPVANQNGDILKIKLFADTGADSGCCNTAWAWNNFPEYITLNNRTNIIRTGSGTIKPKYVLWMTFPAKSGIILKAKLYLMDNLPVDILADINMLKAFGYTFKDETPPLFQREHFPQPDIEAGTGDYESMMKINKPSKRYLRQNDLHLIKQGLKRADQQHQQQPHQNNPFTRWKQRKHEYLTLQSKNTVNVVQTHEVPTSYDSITNDDELSYHYTCGSVIPDPEIHSVEEFEQVLTTLNACFDDDDIRVPDTSKSIFDPITDTVPANCAKTNMDLHRPAHAEQFLVQSTPITSDKYANINLNNIDHTQCKVLSDKNTTPTEIGRIANELWLINCDNRDKLDKLPQTTTYQRDTLTEQNDAKMIQLLADYEREHNKLLVQQNDPTKTTPQAPNTFKYCQKIGYNMAHSHQSNLRQTATKLHQQHLKDERQRATERDQQLQKQTPTYHFCLFIMSKQSFLATASELKEAKTHKHNLRLDFNDFSYLRAIPRKYGKRYTKLYEKVCHATFSRTKVFAKYTFDRQTWNVPPARLGILPEHRDKIMYAPQYPINREKRLHMITYTIENDKNGFWVPIDHSLHSVPYTMVPKKRNGKIFRYRPAFDGRVINQYCFLMPSHMPTKRDFDDLARMHGFTTMVDLKNCFDNIPLHILDQIYAVCPTPLGLRMMLHLTYGWKNSAPNAQAIVNRLCVAVGFCIGYIDDILLKHPFEYGTDQIVAQLNKLFDFCEKHNILLNPTKFFPCCEEYESFGIKRTMDGSEVSDAYKSKFLLLAKPKTKGEWQSIDGILGYISNYIYHGATIKYWIRQLAVNMPEKGGKINWTPQADLAWAQLMYLLENLPILYTPTREGQYLVKTDACNYGVGAVLYQQQFDEQRGTKQWKIIDMWSMQMPKDSRGQHSMVHEAIAVVHALAHWQFDLIRNKFILALDNDPIANIFAQPWRNMNDSTQRLLARLRTKCNMFHYEVRHVAGIHNEVADGLSRFTAKLFNSEERQRVLRPIHSTDTKEKPIPPEVLESAIFKYHLTESQKLRNKQRFLSKSSKALPLPTIQEQFAIELNTVNIQTSAPVQQIHTKLRLKRNELQSRYRAITNEGNCSWNNILQQFRLHTTHSIYASTVDFLNTQSVQHALASDELEFNTNAFISLSDGVTDLITNLSGLSPSTKNKVHKITYQQQQQSEREHKVMYLHQQIETNNATEQQKDDYHKCLVQLVNVNKQNAHELRPYQLNDDLSDDQIDREMRTVKRRKQRSRKAKRQQSRDIDDDNNNQNNNSSDEELDDRKEDFAFEQFEAKDRARPVYHIDNIEFENAKQEMMTRDEMLNHLFGRRSGSELFNTESLLQHQNDDNIIHLVKNMLDYEENEWKQDDMDLLTNWDPHLASALQLNQLSISHDGILQIIDYSIRDQENKLMDVIPFVLRGRLMDYFHHNLNCHHFSFEHTYNQIEHRYWWGTMRHDVRKFCKRCLLCKFTNGSIRKRAPLRVRYLPKARQHVFADFLGHVHGRYYILVLIDYATGYTMLIPTKGTDAITIVNAILSRWVPIFGWFTTFETDWGSGFNSLIMRALARSTKFDIQFAEPKNHRSIGKVERVIGFLQTVFRKYNLLLRNGLVTGDPETVWQNVEILLPFFQSAINQRQPRFTSISPNMRMFGTNMRDVSDIGRINREFEALQNSELDNSDLRQMTKLTHQLAHIEKLFKTDWEHYTWISHDKYNEKYKITVDKINKYKKQFQVGREVLYFIGDQSEGMQKWRRRWSGPWVIDKVLNDSTLIIGDPENGNQKRVSFDRIKKYSRQGLIRYDRFQETDEYIEYQQHLEDILTNYSTSYWREGDHIDFTKPLQSPDH